MRLLSWGMVEPDYIHLAPDQVPPDRTVRPFKAVVIVEEPVTTEWRDRVSEWLVRSGCLFMLAWGHECSLWDDSVDYANLNEFDFGDIPDDKFVLTTWHEDEPLSEVLWFAAHGAAHSDVQLDLLVLVHIATAGDKVRMMKAYADALAD